MSSNAPTAQSLALRSTQEAIDAASGWFQERLGDPVIRRVLDAVDHGVLVLDEHRQVVFANRAARELLDGHEPVSLLGLRPGELLECRNADDLGCGASDACRHCAALGAILQGFEQRVRADSRVLTKDGGALDFRVSVAPLRVDGEQYVVVSLNDIQHERRREALERTFFHDILNTCSVVKTGTELLLGTHLEEPQRGDILSRVSRATNRLVDGIRAHRDLLAAEQGRLPLRYSVVLSTELLDQVLSGFADLELTFGKTLQVERGAAELPFYTEPDLLSRVLENLVRNALEASQPGDKITLDCRVQDNQITFSVHNPAVMSEAIKHQVFQRSFSTKGRGRGLGTYSVKLLTERYLEGQVEFVSLPGRGTTFKVRYPIRRGPTGRVDWRTP